MPVKRTVKKTKTKAPIPQRQGAPEKPEHIKTLMRGVRLPTYAVIALEKLSIKEDTSVSRLIRNAVIEHYQFEEREV